MAEESRIEIKKGGNLTSIPEVWVRGRRVGQLCKDRECTRQGISLSGAGLLFPEDLRELANEIEAICKSPTEGDK